MHATIRPYQDADWDRLCDIHDRARLDELRGSVDLAAFLTLAETAAPEGLFDGEVWVAVDPDERVVGFAAVADDELTWLYVDPDLYGRGVGRRLLRHVVSRCGPVVTTEALAGNAPAIALYQSEGFEIVETKTGGMTGNERFTVTGHIMRLEKRTPPLDTDRETRREEADAAKRRGVNP